LIPSLLKGKKQMSAISDFADKLKVHTDKADAAIAGLVEDNATLNATIAALQASQGTLTAEDQALLDTIESIAAGQAAKLEALDALTPPPVPV
jgi:peptidoglycan hydrolase CwlO-like protein